MTSVGDVDFYEGGQNRLLSGPLIWRPLFQVNRHFSGVRLMRSFTKHSLMLSHVNSVRVNLYLMVRVGIFVVGLLCDAYVRMVERAREE